jgi:PAS domain S-box-containing protein
MTEPTQEANELRVLVLPATTADGIAIGRVLSASKISCVVLRNLAEVSAAMSGGVGTVVIAEETLVADGALLVERIRSQEVWSDLPVIVLSRSGREDAPLATIVSQLGNVSVIERPVRTSTLVSMIRSCLRARGRQYQVRKHLADLHDAQRTIRDAEQRFRLLVENITDYAIFMLDTDGRVASWNTGAQHMLGYSAEEILGQPSALLFASEQQSGALLDHEMHEAQAHGRATSTGWRVRKDGERLFVEGVLTAVRDERGHLLGYSKLMKDVTEKRRIEAEREQLLQSERAARGEAERQSRMKDEFLATLSHELRTPLNAILGWAQVLRVKNPTPEVAEGLRVIERNARAQAQIIEDLLDMSSIISGKVRLAMQKIDLASVVDTSIKAVRPTAEAKGITLEANLGRANGAVAGDPNRLQQVFWNLLTNAVKFTPKEGRVSVTLERVSSHFEINVSDTGEGIDPKFLPHVFERFRQADASASRRHGGLGLGLSIVKQLVELHGGNIHATSGGNGRGSTFTVALPVPAVDVYQTPAESREQLLRAVVEDLASAVPVTNLAGINVLVVDDEPDARSLIERLLQECGAKVTTASSASEAMQQARTGKPDVLISDIGMPKEDGYALIRRIRQLNDEVARVPAIALTAYARPEDRAKAMQAGYQLHVAKPVEAMKLIAMVASLVKRTH